MTSSKPDASKSTAHRTDVVSLIFGLLFLAVAAWWAASYYLDWVITWNQPDAGWALAGGLILLGLFGILASLRRDRRGAEPATAPPAPAAPGFGATPPEAGVGAPPADLEAGRFGDPEPARFANPEPVRFADPEPLRFADPEPVRFADPEPGHFADPEPAQSPDPEPVRPDDPTADLDRPAAPDPGGHRAE